MDTKYAPREIEKVVAATFTFAPRQLRWVADIAETHGLSKAQVIRISLDAARTGTVARFQKKETA